jgi:hypothetical protein
MAYATALAHLFNMSGAVNHLCLTCRRRDRNTYVSFFIVPVYDSDHLRNVVMPAHHAVLKRVALLDLRCQILFRCQDDRRHATRAAITRTSVS